MEKKEAMKILKDFHDKSALFSVRTALDTIIPELKESEDEKIRKEIIDFVKSRGGFKGDWIAWLEKQGDKDKLIKELGEYKVKYTQEVLSQQLEKKSEQKPAEWTAEDEEELKIALNTLEEAGQYSSAKWLKNVCLVSQPKQAWSEEDNKHIKSIISTIECSKAQFPNSPAVLEAYNSDLIWLKSLIPQSQWKPSEEQMKALESIFAKHGAYDDDLLSLISDLKKLKI